MIAPMHAPHGATFNRKFIAAMFTGHAQAIATYRKEAADG
jgi:hypothetical protein